MEWADLDLLGGNQGAPIWVSTCYAKNAVLQQAVLYNEYNTSFPQPSQSYAQNGNRRFDSRQYIVDFSLWMATRDSYSRSLLIMESEAYQSSGVGEEVQEENGYAYDFFKVVWLPSPRRLFVCFVQDDQDRSTLQNSLNQIASTSSHLINQDQLGAYILAPQQGQKNDYRVGIWDATSKQLGWQTAPIGLP
jgi:hypothetical protein